MIESRDPLTTSPGVLLTSALAILQLSSRGGVGEGRTSSSPNPNLEAVALSCTGDEAGAFPLQEVRVACLVGSMVVRWSPGWLFFPLHTLADHLISHRFPTALNPVPAKRPTFGG